jgi:hypothetical protein
MARAKTAIAFTTDIILRDRACFARIPNLPRQDIAFQRMTVK